MQSAGAKLEVAILQGCMKAMDKLIQSFRINKEDRLWKLFYGSLVQIIDPFCSIIKDADRIQLKRREFQRGKVFSLL